jgi:hypothetical protein
MSTVATLVCANAGLLKTVTSKISGKIVRKMFRM